MDCRFCGAEKRAGNFCNSCGGRLIENDVTCVACGNNVVFGPFCHLCGQEVETNQCQSCGSLGQTGNFCKVCGVENIHVAKQVFDPGQVYCRACNGKSDRYYKPGIKVTTCSKCQSDATYLNF